MSGPYPIAVLVLRILEILLGSQGIFQLDTIFLGPYFSPHCPL